MDPCQRHQTSKSTPETSLRSPKSVIFWRKSIRTRPEPIFLLFLTQGTRFVRASRDDIVIVTNFSKKLQQRRKLHRFFPVELFNQPRKPVSNAWPFSHKNLPLPLSYGYQYEYSSGYAWPLGRISELSGNRILKPKLYSNLMFVETVSETDAEKVSALKLCVTTEVLTCD